MLNKTETMEFRKHRAQGWDAKHALQVARYLAKCRALPFYRASDEIVEHDGARFRVKIEHDADHETPWENADPIARGCVHTHSFSRYHEARLPAGHVWLLEPSMRNYGYSYDRAAALAEVKSWGRLYGETLAASIVDAEITRYAGWLNDQWHYVGVIVTLLDAEDEEIEERALWGVESDCEEYIAETMHELADELAQGERNERNERAHWACRDVVTI